MRSPFPRLKCLAAALLVLVPSAALAARGSLPELTFSQIIAKRDTVLIARRRSEPVARESDRTGWGHAQFQMVELLKGDSTGLRTGFSAPCRLEDAATGLFLLAGVRREADDSLRWRLSQPVTEACRAHLMALRALEESGAERLAYFRPFLEHPDPAVATNAHLEFVIATDESFSAACAQMDRVRILRWLKEKPDVPDDRRRLYLAMLARCAIPADADWLRDQVIAESEQPLLDAWIGCYLAATGEDGLPLIQQLYLANPDADFGNVYSAIIALRFVRDQLDQSISRERIIESLRMVLDKPLVADLVVQDLALMRDWDSLDRIVELFKGSDQQFVRLVAINFVRACPDTVAKERLDEFTDIDAKAVNKAHTFFPQGFPNCSAVKNADSPPLSRQLGVSLLNTS